LATTQYGTMDVQLRTTYAHILGVDGSMRQRRLWGIGPRRTEWRISPHDNWVPPSSLLPRIKSLFDHDMRMYKIDDLAILQVDPTMAVMLYLEGILTGKHIRRKYDDYVDFYDVEIDRRFVTVRVTTHAAEMATLDKDGNVL